MALPEGKLKEKLKELESAAKKVCGTSEEESWSSLKTIHDKLLEYCGLTRETVAGKEQLSDLVGSFLVDYQNGSRETIEPNFKLSAGKKYKFGDYDFVADSSGRPPIGLSSYGTMGAIEFTVTESDNYPYWAIESYIWSPYDDTLNIYSYKITTEKETTTPGYYMTGIAGCARYLNTGSVYGDKLGIDHIIAIFNDYTSY